MTVLIGDWQSPGADRRRGAFEEGLRRAFGIAEPNALQQGRNAFNLSRPQLNPAASAQQASGAAALSRSPFNLQQPQLQPTPNLLGAGARGMPPGPIRNLATVAPRGTPGPFPFQGGRNPFEIAGAVGSAIANLPVPGGPITAAPGIRGGRPGATISGVGQPPERTLGAAAEFERGIFQPVTKPIGRFVAEEAVRRQPILRVADVATGGQVSEVAGDVGAGIAGELLLPSNLIPIPIVDLALARLLGVTAKMAKGVTPGVLRALSSNADSIAKAGGEFAPQARKFIDDAVELLKTERGAVPLGPEPPRGGVRPATELVQGQPGVYEGFRAAPLASKGTQEGGTFISSTRKGGEAFQLASRRGVAEGGEVLHRVVIRADKPFVMTDENIRLLARWSIEDIPNRPSAVITDADIESVADLLRRSPLQIETPSVWDTLRKRGYDAIVIKPSDGKLGDVIIGLEPQKIDMIPSRGAQPAPGFEPEPVRPPAGQEAPLFPELEEKAALRANVEQAVTTRQSEPVQQFVGGEDLTGAELENSIEGMIGRAQAAGADETTTNVLSQAYRDAVDLGVTQARAPTSLIERRAPRVAALADNLSSKFQGRVQGGVGEIRERAGMVEHALNEVSKPEVDGLVTGINQRLYGRARTGGFLDSITYVGPDEFADAANGQYRDLVLASTPPEYWQGVPSEFYDDLNALRAISLDRKTTAEALGHPSAASRDNYLRQTWEEVEEALALGTDARTGGLISPSKARIIPNHAVGINAGLTPSQKNVGELLTESIGLWNRAIAESWERKIILDRYGAKGTGQQALASGKAPFQHPLYRGFTADREIVSAVEGLHKPPGKITRGALGEAATFKNTVFGPLDIGVIGVQGLKAIALDGPVILGNQIVRSLAFIRFAPAVRMRELLEAGNLPLTVKMASNGLHLGLGPSAITPGQGTVLKYIPLLKRLDPPISAFIDAKARVEFGIVLNFLRRQIAEGNMLLLHMMGRDLNDPAVWKTGMDWANTMTGASRGAQTPGRRALETAGLTSFQMTRSEMATLGGLVKATLRGTADERILATATLASFGIMIYGLGSAINMAFGNGPVEFDPRNGKWATAQIGGQNIPLMPSRGLVRAISKSIIALQDMDAEKVTQIWAQYTLSKGGPGIVSPAAGAAGFGFQPDVGFRTGDLPAKFRFLNALPLPPLVSQPLIEQDARGAVPLGFSALGFNPFPESVFETREEARNQVSQRLFSQNFGDLDELQQAQVNQDAAVQAEQAKVDKVPARTREGEGFDVSAELRATQQAEQEADDALLAAGTLPGDRWVRNHSEREKRLFAQREAIFELFGISFDDEEAKGRVNEAIDAYFAVDLAEFTDTETGEVDFFGFQQTKKAALDPLTASQKLTFENDILGKFDTAMERRFRDASRVLDAAPVPFQLLSAEEYNEHLTFQRQVSDFREDMLDRTGQKPSVTQAITGIGPGLGKSPGFIAIALALRQGTTTRDRLRNPAYDAYLLEHANKSELRMFFPSLYRRDILQKALFGLEQLTPQEQRPTFNLATPQLSR